MSLQRIHFTRITRSGTARPLCDRANIICSGGNSSALRHEVTCKPCLKRMMDTATWAREVAEQKRETA